MEDMEEYTINDDLRACGLPGDDEDDLASGGEALFGSCAAPINVDAVMMLELLEVQVLRLHRL